MGKKRDKIEATLKVKEECRYEYVRYKSIQMNMEDKKDLQMIITEHINLGLIEPGVSAYSSPGFLVRNHGEIKRGKLRIINIDPPQSNDKKHLQSFLGVVNFASIFIKDLAKYRKDFRPLLKETESLKWKWEEIHTQRVRKLKHVCSNMPKLAIPQDEDELVIYTDANDYRWAAVLMKKTATGEEPCRYTCKFRHAKTQAPQENLEELDREFIRLAVNAQVAEQVQRANLDAVQTTIRSSLVASTALWNALQEPIRNGSPSVMTRESREHDPKHALRVQGFRSVVIDSSTACTRPSSDSGETATIEPQGVQTSDDSSQPSISGVKEGEISLRAMTDTSKRPNMVAFNEIKVAIEEAPLVSAISEDDISTRRAWGL
ncbi:UNVERIFIED_CONTAM: Polyprotein P3 [Sesamum radiatum]|uniref:Polyprotein P3 n=1 Tax=Sesamum radiatum TaxID=300843 RepID=A0AAW2NRD4_SESRA